MRSKRLKYTPVVFMNMVRELWKVTAESRYLS